MKKAAATLLIGTLSAPALHAAPEFGVSVDQLDNGNSRVWLSYLAGDNVTALDFAVDFDLPQPSYVDARRCLASLPKTHRGMCQFSGGVLRGVIYSPANALLKDTNLGLIDIDPGSLLKSSGGSNPSINNVTITAVTPLGVTVDADVQISGPADGK